MGTVRASRWSARASIRRRANGRGVVDSVTTSAVIVPGGAAGVDRQAEMAAAARGLVVVSLPASATMWRRMGNAAGMVRNR